MRKRIFFALFVCLAVALTGQAAAADGEVRELTLKECIQLSLQNNTDLAKGWLDRKLYTLDREIGEQYFAPDLYLYPESDYETDDEGRWRVKAKATVVQRVPTGAELRFNWEHGLNYYSKLEGDQDWTSKVSVTLSQPLLRGAGIEVGTAPMVLSRLDDDYDLYGFEWLVTQRITQIQKRYWDLLLAREKLMVAQDALERSRQMAEERRENASDSDMVELESEVADLELDVNNRLVAETKANLRLLDVLDLPGVKRIVPKGRFDFRPVEIDIADCLEKAFQNRPDLKKARVATTRAALKSKVAKSNAKPDVDLTVSASSSATEEDSSKAMEVAYSLDDDIVVGMGAEFRFGVPGRKRDAVAARYRLIKAELDLKEREQSVRNDVTTSVYAATSSLKSIKLAQRARVLAQKKLDAAMEALMLGQGDSLKVLIYQRDFTEARLDEYEAIVSYLYDLADLDESMGTALSTWQVEVRQ